MRSLAVSTLAVSAALAAPADAQFIDPVDYGWSRGDADSTWFEWDVFTSTSGGNVPDVGQFPDPLPDGWVEPDVVETTGDGFITGSGNIYSPFSAIELDVTVPNYGTGAGSTTVLLQLRVAGQEMDTSGVKIGGEFPVEIRELGRVNLGDFGFQVDWLFVFELDGNDPAYLIHVPTIETSVSIDRIAIDTFTEDAGCVADFNADGVVNTQDVIAYLNAWTAGDASADVNDDGAVDTRDFLEFLNLWNAGC